MCVQDPRKKPASFIAGAMAWEKGEQHGVEGSSLVLWESPKRISYPGFLPRLVNPVPTTLVPRSLVDTISKCGSQLG